VRSEPNPDYACHYEGIQEVNGKTVRWLEHAVHSDGKSMTIERRNIETGEIVETYTIVWKLPYD
jgi:hypothetical protein